MEIDLWYYRGTITAAATILLALACFLRGGGPERYAATILLAMQAVDRIYHFIATGGRSIWIVSDYTTIDLGHLLIDAVSMVCFAILALRANRVYTLWIGGLQLVMVLSHFGRELAATIHPLAYAISSYTPFYLQTTILLIGLMLHVRRMREWGSYRDWR